MTAHRALRVLALLALAAGSVRAQANEAEGRPALRLERVGAQVVGGTYAGVAGYMIGRGIGTVATQMLSEEHDHMRDEIVNGVGVVGAGLAIAGTVYAIGDLGAETGSFRQTLGGVAIGSVASLAISHLVFRGRIPADKWSARRKWWVATLECSLPAIGGTIAFNNSRKWQR